MFKPLAGIKKILDGGGGAHDQSTLANPGADGLFNPRQNPQGGNESQNRFMIWLYIHVVNLAVPVSLDGGWCAAE